MMIPKVSVVITSIGRNDLKFSVNSVKNQTYNNIEIVLVLDGELPDGVDTENLKIIHMDGVKNGNVSRNAGIKASSGEFIALLDDDDVFYADKVQEQIEQIRNEEDVTKVVSYTKVKLISSENGDQRILPPSSIKRNEKIIDYLFRPIEPGFMQTSTLLAHRSIFLNNPFDETVPMHQDWDWLVNIQNDPSIYFLLLDKVLVEYRVNKPGSSVGTQNKWRYSIKWFAKYENKVSDESKAQFRSAIIRNIMIDQRISKKQRSLESFRVLREIPFKYVNLRLRSMLKIAYHLVKN